MRLPSGDHCGQFPSGASVRLDVPPTFEVMSPFGLVKATSAPLGERVGWEYIDVTSPITVCRLVVVSSTTIRLGHCPCPHALDVYAKRLPVASAEKLSPMLTASSFGFPPSCCA